MADQKAKMWFEKRHVQRGEGYLVVFTRYYAVDPERPEGEFFEWKSLAKVLGRSRSWMETLYRRKNLDSIVKFIPTGVSRPVRAFRMEDYDTVVEVLGDPHAQFEPRMGVSGTQRAQQVGADGIMVKGEEYFTVDTLAARYGLSGTTIRLRLEEADLLRYFRNITEPGRTGRPRRGIHHRFEEALEAAIDGGMNAEDIEELGLMPEDASPLMPFDRLVEQAERHGYYLVAKDAPEDEPQLLNTVNPAQPDVRAQVDTIMAELESVVGTGKG